MEDPLVANDHPERFGGEALAHSFFAKIKPGEAHAHGVGLDRSTAR